MNDNDDDNDDDDDDNDDDDNDDDDDNNNNNNNNNNSTLGTKQVGPRRSDLPRSYSAGFISNFGLATNSPGCGIFLWFPVPRPQFWDCRLPYN